MFFHSLEFLFVFLPITVIGCFLLRKISLRAALGWLTIASLFFYGWWNPRYLLLIGASIVVNYYLGLLLQYGGKRKRFLLGASIAANLCLLAVFKYADFAVGSIDALGFSFTLPGIILPLGISFFTFEQIAWLIEIHQGTIKKPTPLQYCTFITNFPKLIAGPIIRPHELLPQLSDPAFGRAKAENISVGLTILIIGLFKKVALADAMAPLADPVFHASAQGMHISFFEAWGAALAFGLQIYFDFSGYTDMAIGSARLVGLRLPLNFASPYQATNIIDFWRRWHMSLTRFLRDFVYIPLGGSRCAPWKRMRNLLATMLLSGLWHGAGWTFILWGGLHGILLILNHTWRSLVPPADALWRRLLGWIVTFPMVTMLWVFFRAESVRSAFALVTSMVGLHGIARPSAQTLLLPPGMWMDALPWIGVMLAITLFLPNTQQLLRSFMPAYDAREDDVPVLRCIQWRPSAFWSLALSACTVIALSFVIIARQTEFLYFQF